MLLALAAMVFLTACSGGEQMAPASPQTQAIAQCLTENGFSMYGADWCPHCQEQKRMFGTAFEDINYVNCELDRQQCQEANVQGIPMWSDGNVRLEGTQTPGRLAEAAGCELGQSA